jgi:uncharacterized protein YndB with AHSA1/START domain
MSNTTNSVQLHRVLRSSPERIYNAFLNPYALAKWLPPHGFVGEVDEMDAQVGGGYRMSFINLGTGSSNSFSGQYVELLVNEKIAYINRFDDPNLAGEMHVSVSLKKVICGTEIRIIQSGIPVVIPVEFCYLGWQESLTLLAYLVEADISGAP